MTIERAVFKCVGSRSQLRGFLIRLGSRFAFVPNGDTRSLLFGKIRRRRGFDVLDLLNSPSQFVGTLRTFPIRRSSSESLRVARVALFLQFWGFRYLDAIP